MLHLQKLAVGIRTLAELTAPPDNRRVGPPTTITTRQMPRRAPEILDGGSLYWVIANAAAVRQRILAITPATRHDGTPCTRIDLEPTLTIIAPRPVRPFQGWRYLHPDDAPPDLDAQGTSPGDMPLALRLELMSLCLL